MTSLASADVSRLAEALRESGQEADVTTQDVLLRSANYLKADMESRVPVRTGKLKQSIQIRVKTHEIVIGPDTEYDAFVELGTQPHVIKAKTKKALAFKMGGRTVIVRSVKHPGTKAQPYVRPAFDDWVDTLGALVAEAQIQKLEDKAQ